MGFNQRNMLVNNSPFSGTKASTVQAFPMISVVTPAYCEEGNLSELYKEIVQLLGSLPEKWELIIVDDGSTDGTWNEISSLCHQDARVKGLRLSRNFGHQYALFAGLSNATGRAVITMDADLQHPPAVILQLLEQWHKGNKIVHTIRIDHQNISWIKKTTSRIFYKIFSFLSGVELDEGMADFRLLDRQVVDELLQIKEGGLFLRGLIHWLGYPSSKVDFRCRNRFSGNSKYNLTKMLKLAWRGITSFSIIPLRVATILGVITSLIAFSELAYALWAKLFTDRTVPGWTSAISIVSLLLGVLFILLGLMGEYIGRIFEEVRQRPRFIVSEQIGFTLSDTNTIPVKSSLGLQNFDEV